MASIDDYKAFALNAATQYNIPADLLLWQIGTESSWNPQARNPTPGSTAYGLGQFTDATAKDRGVDPTNPYDSILGTASYMADLKNKTGSWLGALDAYGTTKNNPAKQAEAKAIINSTYQDCSGNVCVSFPTEESKGTGGSTGDSSTLKNSVYAIILALLGIVLIVLSFTQTDTGKNIINLAIKKV